MSDAGVDWADANRRYLASSVVHVRQLLDAYVARARGEQSHPVDRTELADLAARMSRPPALERLCRVFNLSAFERDVLLMCAASELDASFAAACAAAHGDPRRTQAT